MGFDEFYSIYVNLSDDIRIEIAEIVSMFQADSAFQVIVPECPDRSLLPQLEVL